MRRVRCYECGKSYDYDEEDFCPKCGAFNQPPPQHRNWSGWFSNPAGGAE